MGEGSRGEWEWVRGGWGEGICGMERGKEEEGKRGMGSMVGEVLGKREKGGAGGQGYRGCGNVGGVGISVKEGWREGGEEGKVEEERKKERGRKGDEEGKRVVRRKG